MMRIGALFHGLGSEHGTYNIGQLVLPWSGLEAKIV